MSYAEGTTVTVDPKSAGRWLNERFEQNRRTRWRAVVLLLKAKLELIQIGISTIEHEFMADMLLPNGDKVGTAIPEIIRLGLIDAVKMLGTGVKL
jgi:hypothetical protein